MKAEQEKISAKVRAVSMHLNGGKLQLPAGEFMRITQYKFFRKSYFLQKFFYIQAFLG